jgi:hypothetical protein
MRCLKPLLVACLIPSLIAASEAPLSDSVKSLLRKPRTGEVQISLTDGTSMGGYVARVTTESLLFQRFPGCQTVELSKIKSVRWVDRGGYSFDDMVGIAFYLIVISPFLLVYGVESLFTRHDSLRGTWESIPVTPDDKTTRLTFEGNFIALEDGLVKKGTWQVNGSELNLTYKGGLVETIPFRIDCDRLILSSPNQLELRWANAPSRHVDPPIVGRWQKGGYNSDRTYWELQLAGTFETGVMSAPTRGAIRKIKGGLRVTWQSPVAAPEDWRIRIEKDHLLVTKDGATTEYRRTAAVAW